MNPPTKVTKSCTATPARITPIEKKKPATTASLTPARKEIIAYKAPNKTMDGMIEPKASKIASNC